MPDFDTSVPHIARVYDYWLGGQEPHRPGQERAVGPDRAGAVRR